MSDSDRAQEQLRIIRSLMERSTIYRSISAPTALIGGLLSLGGFATAYYAKHHRHHAMTASQFLVVWLVILALTGLSNLIFLWRGAVQRGEPLFSAGMKCAATSLAPAFFTAGVLTFLIHRPIQLCILWLVLYGLGLLATRYFAPRSLSALGTLFLFSGGIMMTCWKHLFLARGQVEPSALVVSGIMAATFGGFHLAYAAAVWALDEDRKRTTTPHV